MTNARYKAPSHSSKIVLSIVNLGPPKRNRTWAGGPTVLLDNRESRGTLSSRSGDTISTRWMV